MIEDPPKPTRGVFKVSVRSTEDDKLVDVFQTGPEKRPFKKLKAIDVDDVAAMVMDALSDAQKTAGSDDDEGDDEE